MGGLGQGCGPGQAGSATVGGLDPAAPPGRTRTLNKVVQSTPSHGLGKTHTIVNNIDHHIVIH
ncbi:MAG: hypothetical protein ACXVXF_05725, partial [Mycobacteriaceae bacterium]